MLFKDCGVAIHLCKQCGRVLPFFFKSLLMISGTDCGQCGEILRDLTHMAQIASWQHINIFLQCHLISMCVPRHLHLDLSQHVLQNISRIRLRAHALLMCRDADVRTLRRVSLLT